MGKNVISVPSQCRDIFEIVFLCEGWGEIGN